jgi:hypothetical protein
MQDRTSGARANKWGRETARAIAREIGACDMKKASNECMLAGRRAVIKCAARKTSSVGVTYKMLDRVATIVGAFEQAKGVFRLFALSPETVSSDHAGYTKPRSIHRQGGVS